MKELIKSIRDWFLSPSFWVGVPVVLIWFNSLVYLLGFAQNKDFGFFTWMLIVILHTSIWMLLSTLAFVYIDKFIEKIKKLF
jgi:apolipoprotein N-acyltransferase